MEKNTQEKQICTEGKHCSIIEEIAREGARKMLQLALENEVVEYIEDNLHQPFCISGLLLDNTTIFRS